MIYSKKLPETTRPASFSLMISSIAATSYATLKSNMKKANEQNDLKIKYELTGLSNKLLLEPVFSFSKRMAWAMRAVTWGAKLPIISSIAMASLNAPIILFWGNKRKGYIFEGSESFEKEKKTITSFTAELEMESLTTFSVSGKLLWGFIKSWLNGDLNE